MPDQLAIESDVIALTPTTESDLDLVIALEQHPDNSSFVMQWPVRQHLAAMAEDDIAHLVVVSKTDNTVVGYAILTGLESPHRNIKFQRLVIDRKGHGFGREVLRLVKALAFDRLGAHRLWLDVMEHNRQAFALYESEGFVVEGMLREFLLKEDRYISLFVMSMLDREYTG
jgi:RimJ/RimL family protein N-acetyltransferase